MDGDKWHYSLWDSRHAFCGVGTSSSPDPRWPAPAVLECHFLLCLRHCIATQRMHCLFPHLFIHPSNQFTITTYPALKVVGVTGFYPSCHGETCASHPKQPTTPVVYFKLPISLKCPSMKLCHTFVLNNNTSQFIVSMFFIDRRVSSISYTKPTCHLQEYHAEVDLSRPCQGQGSALGPEDGTKCSHCNRLDFGVVKPT